MTDGIIVYAAGCNSEEQFIDSFSSVVQQLEQSREKLFNYPDDVVLELFSRFGKEILQDPNLIGIPGLPYLSLWLRRDNLQSLFSVNFGKKSHDGKSQHIDKRTRMICVPRGVVCHWIAGNIPLLGFFSFVLASIGKNASILKIDPSVSEIFCLLLRKLKQVSVFHDGVTYTGSILSDSASLVSFSGKNSSFSSAFSRVADCRVVYGSEEAVSAISRLPCQAHADTIIYGPKYSFAIFDSEMVCSANFSSMLEGLARDIVYFNQAACSSPHTIFFEKSPVSLRVIGEKLRLALDTLPDRLFTPLDEGTALAVINTRGRYALDITKDILLSDDLKWTICINDNFSLEEPVQGRCVFLKEVSDIRDVLPLITRKVQTVGLGLGESKREEYIRELAYRGVDRVMIPGTMHEYTQPWDGMLGAGRMVRWIAVRDG